jgi:hypothetical protein
MFHAARGAHARRLVSATLLIGLSLLTTNGISPVQAGVLPSTMTSGAEVDGTVILSSFPCVATYPPGCAATFSGTFRGTVSGLDVAGNAYVLTFPDPTVGPVTSANLSASGGYDDVCAAWPVVLPPSGRGGGNFAVTGGLLVDNGVTSHGAQLTGGFGWVRDGTVASFGLSSGTVSTGGTTVATNVVIGEGVGQFVPLGGPAWCAPGGIQSNYPALISGVHLVPA